VNDIHACNCAYGTDDPRCCVARAQREHDRKIWEMGRRGEPLPPEPDPSKSKSSSWTDAADSFGTISEATDDGVFRRLPKGLR
jgi:hypothetical protein